MARWLVKQEPDAYSFADLARDGETDWDGVANPLAVKHLRTMVAGDPVFYYHTGKDKCIVGVAEVVRAADGESPVRLRAVGPLAAPVSLAAVKADGRFADWELVRQSRLSVMPVPDDVWAAVVGMSG